MPSTYAHYRMGQQVRTKMKLDNDTFENTVKSRFFRMTDKQVLY